MGRGRRKTRTLQLGGDLGPPMMRLSPWGCVIELPGEAGLTLDAASRWLSARLDGLLYRRVLDGGVVIYPGPHRPPEDLDAAAVSAVHSRVAKLAEWISSRLDQGPSWTLTVDPDADAGALRGMLERCAQMTAGDYQRERERYLAAYPDEAIEILPPDRYRDLVVLPATGCPNGGCTFCAFYRDRPLRRLSDQAFSAHLEALKLLFGEALALRTGFFLGSASALSLSQSAILSALDRLRAELGVKERGVAAFWDPDHCPTRSVTDWRALQAAGLRAAYVGLETGLAELRDGIGKSADLDRLVAAVRDLEPAGLRRGLIVLSGVGGEARIDAHLRATVRVIEAMQLTPSDLVYVSPLASSLTKARLDEQTHRLRDALRDATPAKVARYAIASFRYYA